MATATHVLSSQRLDLVLDYLSAPDAFRCAVVCSSFAKTLQLSDARRWLRRLRPKTWKSEGIDELSQEFCRRLLRDWHLCLKHSACQVAYVRYDQHLFFVEPSSSMAPAPQGSDPFPVNVDAKSYKCSIEEFYWDCLWWKCLDNELFRWPQEELLKEVIVRGSDEDGRGRRTDDEDDRRRGADDEVRVPLLNPEDLPPGAVVGELRPFIPTTKTVPHELEAVPGYRGDLSLPDLCQDVLAVLSLNAAWFDYSFWTRQLQAILLLRDGRFLLIGTCELQGTIESQASARVYRCFVSDSLMSLVTFAQDPRSREILRTTLPGDEKMDSGSKEGDKAADMLTVKLPRVDREDRQSVEGMFGAFLKASQESFDHVLFSNLQMNQKDLRKDIKAGDKVRVKRQGETFIWSSCQCDTGEFPLGQVAPDTEEEMLQQCHSKDRRWLTYSGGCHLGLKDGRCYEAEVIRVLDASAASVDLQYTDASEWASGNSGFTSGQGRSRSDAFVEADVDVERLQMMPKSRWYWSFKNVWEPCGGFSQISLSFGDSGEGGLRCFAGSSTEEAKAESSSSEDDATFLQLADALADSLPAHRFRCRILSREMNDSLAEEKQLIEELTPSAEGLPRQQQMVAGKRLFLKLLRVPSFWKKWVDQGGESPAQMTTLFKKEKFVRLIIQ
mmetsp:Transcript_6669/g.10978  ORF Transcript_6669/g.10978 Transcript_6669/m.10978 type:complete len:668 (-) Transcript_6669:121-2124(-)